MKVTFPHMGNIWVTIQTLFESLGVEVIVPPMSSKRTLNLGTKIAPEAACLPLKVNLGNYIEAAEQGADTIVITGGIGPCRFGLYGEVERQIMQDAGYDYDAVILEAPDGNLAGLAQRIRYLAGRQNSWTKIIQAIHFAYTKSIAMDRIEHLFHQARPILNDPVRTEMMYTKAQHNLAQAMSYRSVKETVHLVQENITEKLEKQRSECEGDPERPPLRIAVIGEIYTILDPFTSLEAERQFGNLGIHVDRSIYLSGWVGAHVFQGMAKGYRPLKPYKQLAKPYLKHFVGGHGLETVGAAVYFSQRGFDGIVQLLPLNCMPEIVASSILPEIERDYGVPVMSLTVDEHTGTAGFQTRLEAFADLLARRSRPDRNAVQGVDGYRVSGK